MAQGANPYLRSVIDAKSPEEVRSTLTRQGFALMPDTQEPPVQGEQSETLDDDFAALKDRAQRRDLGADAGAEFTDVEGGGGWKYRVDPSGAIKIIDAPPGHEKAVGMKLSATDGGLGSAIAREVAQITGDDSFVKAGSPGFAKGPSEEPGLGPVEPEMTAVNAQTGEDTVQVPGPSGMTADDTPPLSMADHRRQIIEKYKNKMANKEGG